jgi:acyl-coenzyme A thioesterase PaaI-like protein
VAESLRSRLVRWGFNWFPAFRRTGGRLVYVADDWHEVRVKLPLNWTTRNYVGTMFGGSLYAATDGQYMVMLIKLLGSDYIVWDKGASIRYRKPCRTTVYATFVIDEREIDAIRALLVSEPKIDRQYQVDWADREGTIYATVETTIHIRRKESA